MKSASWVRSAGKENLAMGSWKKGKMPKNLIKTKGSFQLSGAWAWRIITFTAEGGEYIVLLAHRADRTDFLAMLLRDGKECTVLCRVEHHGSHPGWHVHYQAERPFSIGVTTDPKWKKRDCSKGSSFGPRVLSGFDRWAMTLASELFRLDDGRDTLI